MGDFIVFREPAPDDKKRPDGFSNGFFLRMGVRKDSHSYYPREDFNRCSEMAQPIPDDAEFEEWEQERIARFYDPRQTKKPPLESKPLGYEDASLYFTHDNMSRPFAVYIAGSDVSVYTYQRGFDVEEEKWQVYTEKVCEYKNTSSILIGEDPHSMEWPDQTDPDFCKGACILVQVTLGHYVFICTTVKSFEFDLEPILSLRGTLGNNDVIYPVAETKTRYLFLGDGDDVWIVKDKLVVVPPEDRDRDLYYHFYGHAGHPPKLQDQHKLRNVQLIHDRR
jgi:hypothetical protein